MKKLLALLVPSLLLALSSFAQSTIYKGTKVNILEIAPSDSYYGERATFLGKSATALGDLVKNSDGFYSGTLEVENGRTCFFKSVKVSTADSPSKSFDSGSLFYGTIPSGTKFKILEVPSSDAYYSDRSTIEGKTGTTSSSLTLDNDGYVSGSLSTDDGKSYYFYKVRLGKVAGSSSASTSSSSSKPVKYITGTIAVGTHVYVADISPDDSYYSDRSTYIGKAGKVTKSAMVMKSDGYYAGDFLYDDGSTAYFYKAKFSKDPVAPSSSTSSSSSSSSTSSSSKSDDEWTSAKGDDDILQGDKVEITAVSPEDSYYSDKDDYIGKKGVAGDDLEYDDSGDGYSGTVILDDGSKPYFYLVKIKRIKSGSSTYKSSSTSSSSGSIAKGTKVVVTDVDPSDSYYSSKSTYIGKIGKVAEGLNLQGSDTYSGKILFDDGSSAYFYKVKVTILK